MQAGGVGEQVWIPVDVEHIKEFTERVDVDPEDAWNERPFTSVTVGILVSRKNHLNAFLYMDLIEMLYLLVKGQNIINTCTAYW